MSEWKNKVSRLTWHFFFLSRRGGHQAHEAGRVGLTNMLGIQADGRRHTITFRRCDSHFTGLCATQNITGHVWLLREYSKLTWEAPIPLPPCGGCMSVVLEAQTFHVGGW